VPLRTELWRTVARHQLAALASTNLDFASMIALVERLGVRPVLAAWLGATVGGVSNFALGRAWIFRRPRGHPAAQAVRYAVVSATSAGLNAAGEHLLHDLGGMEYVVARLIGSVAVSLLWNFPTQRRFVFRDEA
jgi:putative flippase GtrA